MTSAESRAKTSEFTRPSYPITTLREPPGVDEEPCEPRSSLGHDDPVHPERAPPSSARSPAVPNCSRPSNRSASARTAGPSPSAAASIGRGQLVAGLGVGVLRQPRPRGAEHLVEVELHDAGCPSAATTRASRSAITGSACLPASSTSVCDSGVFWMPAARFVMSENPRTSMPA